MTAHRYWRLYISANGGGAYAAIDEIEMRTAADGSGTNQSLTGNGTATASSEYSASYIPSYAFDAVSANRWNSGNPTYSGGVGTEWIKWDFGAGNEKDINHLKITNTTQEPANTHVLNATLQYSDDDAVWTAWIGAFGHPSTSGASASYVRSIYTFALTLPMPTLSLAFGDRFALSMPMPTLDLRTAPRFALSLPMPTVNFKLGAIIGLNMPMPTVVVEAGPSVAQNTLVVAMPMPTVAMRGAARLAVALPMPAVVISGTTTILVQVEAVMPMPTVDLRITSTSLGSVTVELPMPAVSMRLGGSVGALLPMPVVSMRGVTGGLISIAAVMPMAEVSCRFTSGGVLQVNATMPMLVAGPWGRIVAVMPMAQVLMSGQTVIAITYEAYAVNLAHQPKRGVEPVDEVTRYSNYPFHQIVRYQGEYYGVGATGVFLISGLTDAGTDITWALKTAMSDSGKLVKKTLRAARFGGRLGPAATVTLYAGESGSTPYAYTTPRDATPQNYRQKFGRGLKGRYHALGVTGTGVLALDTIDLEVDNMTRSL